LLYGFGWWCVGNWFAGSVSIVTNTNKCLV
jgi:hypothetical protein